ETGETYLLDTTDPAIRQSFFTQANTRKLEREKLFKSMNIDFVDIYTHQSYVEPLIRFFRMRAKRFH
ncbi:DUF58 domain-containing protein, partial [candidate division KSB1 bacterium]